MTGSSFMFCWPIYVSSEVQFDFLSLSSSLSPPFLNFTEVVTFDIFQNRNLFEGNKQTSVEKETKTKT